MTRGPRPKNPIPEWALALRMRRLQLGNLTQEDIQARSGDTISQGTVSDLERGKITLDSLNVIRANGLARALGWTLADLQDATGVDLGAPRAEPLPTTTEPNPVYSLQQLKDPTAQPLGLNLTPSVKGNPANWRQTIMDGDEMEPRIRDGESIYFDTDRTTPEKGVFVIIHQDRVYVRRYSDLPSGPAWTADNPAYAHQFIPHTPSVQVLGRIYRVVGIRDDKSLN
ncbi:XRE family transcriptional regulator [Deinococcus hohokamensis]|uniref:XRE family transcriptional regulator n=1 Tax=Deinococcus hohokamensis TaxID=309883 RepID=UPI0036D3F4CA